MISPQQFARYAASPAAFRDDLLIDCDGTVKRLGDVLDDWQRRDFEALDPGLMVAAGRAIGTPIMRAYLERGRGHSKTTDIAVLCAWALAFAARPVRCFAYAADKDQAALLKDAVGTIVRLNPWLANVINVTRGNVIENIAPKHPGQGGSLTIESSDVGSSFGILPDIIIADELCHWEGDGSLWHSLISSAAKRGSCFLAVISNAGFSDSWQWAVREAARTDCAWYFSRLDGPQASWLTPARLAEQRRMLPAIAFARLWENQWSSGGGDALAAADIAAAFDSGLQPMTGKETGFLFVGGVDLGLKRDCSSVVILAVPDGRYGKLRLAHHRLWRPTLGRKIDLAEVERHILELDAQFGLEACAFDPWQAELLASRIEADSNRRRRNQRRREWSKPFMREIAPTASNLREQATSCIEHFQDRRLELFDCEPLRRDLLKVRIEERSYGIRLTSPRDGDGHGDSFSAFALALLIGHEISNRRPTIAGAVSGDKRLSPLQAALARGEREAAAFAREQERFRNREGEDVGQIAWQRLMRERANPFS